MKTTFALGFLLMSAMLQAQSLQGTLDQIDYSGFEELTNSVSEYRNGRLVDLKKFKALAADEHTIILDTRSKRAYDERHVKGAVHLNFSDFTAEKLAAVIPSKDTRILIYCNNNFVGSPFAFAMKSAPLALNIPTFINLVGYGYENVYELGAMVTLPSGELEMEGSYEDRMLKLRTAKPPKAE